MQVMDSSGCTGPDPIADNNWPMICASNADRNRDGATTPAAWSYSHSFMRARKAVEAKGSQPGPLTGICLDGRNSAGTLSLKASEVCP